METLPFPRRGPASGWLRGEGLYLSIEPGQANFTTTDDSPEQLIELFSVTRLALPDREHAPPKCLEAFCVTTVAIDIGRELGHPEIATRRWSRCVPASRMSVPEAAMYQYDRSVARQHDVRTARQSPVVKAESQTCSVEVGANDQFGPCVAAPDSGHHPGPGLPIDDVGQGHLPNAVRGDRATCQAIDGQEHVVRNRTIDPVGQIPVEPPGSMRTGRRVLVGRTTLNTRRRIISCPCL